MLTQSGLARTVFPVGDFEKAEVRRLAAEFGLRTAPKPDSQDVCFITSTGWAHGRSSASGSRSTRRASSTQAAPWSARYRRSRW